MTEQLAKPVPRCAYEDDLLGISRCTRTEDLYDTDFGWLCNEHYRMTIRMVAYESRVRELEQALSTIRDIEEARGGSWLNSVQTIIDAVLHAPDKAVKP